MRSSITSLFLAAGLLASLLLCSCGKDEGEARKRRRKSRRSASSAKKDEAADSGAEASTGEGPVEGEPPAAPEEPGEAGVDPSLRKAFAGALSAEKSDVAKASLLDKLDKLYQRSTSPGSVLETKKIPLLIMGDEVDNRNTDDAAVMTAAKTGRDLGILDLPVLLATVECGRQNGIEFSPVRLVSSGGSFAEHLGQLEPQPQYAMLIRSSPRGPTSFGGAGGLQANFAYLFALNVRASTFLDNQQLLAMATFSAAQTQDGKVAVNVLTSQALEDFVVNVGGIGLAKLQQAVHGDVIARELERCAGLSGAALPKPEAGKKEGGQTTRTEITVRAGQFTVCLDAPQGSPDRCWELRGEPLRAELPPGTYTIYVYDRVQKQMHCLQSAELEADKSYTLLK